MENILDQLAKKYQQSNEPLESYLSGLLHAKPITYWDYVETDTLLSLQKPRTDFPDEMVFIMYHQVNELLFKMILWEIEQISQLDPIDPKIFVSKLGRISRYFDMLSSSFSIMQDGMEVKQYLQFRDTLKPASGFQSAQYRMVEIGSTELINLIDHRFRATIDRDTPYEHAFEHMYWQAAGKDHATGEKTVLVQKFEEKYKAILIGYMEAKNTTNLLTKFKSLPKETQQDPSLIAAMRHYDYTVNVTWVMAHLNAANHYLETEKGVAEATGGSDWKKYMHPKYQRRIFFPELWSADELANWGQDVG